MTYTLTHAKEPTGLSDHERALFGDPRRGDRYDNPWEPMPARGPRDLLKWKLAANPWRARRAKTPPLPRHADPIGAWRQAVGDRLLWNGHATFLIELDGLTILIDPVFGSASPAVPRAQPSPLTVANAPKPDVIVLTHGHYDHFEYRTLARLGKKHPGALFVVPQGLERYLPKGLTHVSLTWWQCVHIQGVRLCATPAQHWHQRGLRDTNRALWCGWHIQGTTRTVYHTGDSGYVQGFGAVSKTLGCPDVMLLPMGAFEPRWFMGYQHMAPEDALRMWDDVGAPHVIPMHWGTFDLADEPLDYGPEHFEGVLLGRGREQDLERVHLMRLGETLGLGEDGPMRG